MSYRDAEEQTGMVQVPGRVGDPSKFCIMSCMTEELAVVKS